MKILNTLLLLTTIISYLSAQDCVPERYKYRVFEDINITRDIVYGSADPYDVLDLPIMQDLTLDFYEPVGDNLDKRPLVVSCYGGAFLFGTKNDSDVEAWCDSLTHRGYACAAINYRLGLNPAQERSAYRAVYRAVQDLRAAIRYLQEDPNDLGFNVDPDNIFVEGQSAGAITAIHAAFLTAEERPVETEADALSIDEGSDLGCLDCSGNSFVQPVKIKGILSMWGAVESLDFIDAEENTPMLMVHGDSDPVVPYGTGRPFSSPFFPEVHGSSIMQPWLDQVGIYNEFYPYENNSDHTVYGEPIAMTFPQPSWFDIFENSQKFLYKLLQFDSPMPTGASTVNLNDSQTYSITNNPTSTYCWSITGGTITQNDGTSVMVTWDGNIPDGQVQVVEVNYFGLRGEPTVFDVSVMGTTTLPITLNAFEGQQINNTIQLNWLVDSEVNLSHYNLEKSIDGQQFLVLNTQQKNNNFHTQQAYSFVDSKPQKGINYYRLQSVDKDGHFTYSSTIGVNFATSIIDLKILTNNKLEVHFESNTFSQNHLKIFNQHGQIVHQQVLNSQIGTNQISLFLNTLPKGIYVLQIEQNGQWVSKKFVW